MKKISIFFTALLIVFAVNTKAQLRMPQPSSSQTIIQEFGLGTITVKYSRPNVKGRKIFTDIVPYGEVWRTGANDATLITFTENVTLEGKALAAGEYALFTIPNKENWTIILNKGTKQWGAYQYKPEEDVLRLQVKSTKLNDRIETFTIGFSEVYPSAAKLNLMWDDTSVSLNMVTDIDTKIMAGIDAAMKTEKKPYFEAAQYYYDNGKDLSQALQWINIAEAADQQAPWVKYLKARIQLKSGDKKGAAITAAAGIQAAKAKNIPEYIRLNSAVLAQAKK